MKKTLAYVKGLGYVNESVENFLKVLEDSKGNIINPRDETYARLHTKRKENIGFHIGTWTSVGFEYVKDQSPIVRLQSRLLNKDLAQQTVETNLDGHYFSIGSLHEYQKLQREAEIEMEKEPVDWNIFVLPSRDNFTMSNGKHWNILQAFLKDQAQPYFELNGPIAVKLVNKEYVDTQIKNIITQLWFGSLLGGSIFYGCDKNLNLNWGARWVDKKNNLEGIA